MIRFTRAILIVLIAFLICPKSYTISDNEQAFMGLMGLIGLAGVAALCADGKAKSRYHEEERNKGSNDGMIIGGAKYIYHNAISPVLQGTIMGSSYQGLSHLIKKSGMDYEGFFKWITTIASLSLGFSISSNKKADTTNQNLFRLGLTGVSAILASWGTQKLMQQS